MSQRIPPLAPLFSPTSVAVIGASRSRAKIGGIVLANLLAAGYRGSVLPVNPAAAAARETVQGLAPLASCRELPEGMDLALICLPQKKALPALRELADRRVRAAAVLAAGFRETGRAGAEAERALREIALGAGMLLLGPNSLGLINTACRLNASCAPLRPRSGTVGFFSQSGTLCVSVLDWAESLGLGFSSFVSLGSKTLLDESAVLRRLGADPATKVIAGYCESVRDGAEFLAAAREVAARKPVLILKAGDTPAGARAVSAHTGTVPAAPAAFRAALRQAGVIQVDELEQLCPLALTFATQPEPEGPGLAVLANSSGAAVLAADACAASGLSLPSPSAETLSRLSAVVSGLGPARNPVDIRRDAGPERYRAALEALAADTRTHAVLVIFVPAAQADPEAAARAVIAVADGPANVRHKPFATCFLGGGAMRGARALLSAAGIPSYAFPEAAVAGLAALYRRSCAPPPHRTSPRENFPGPPWSDVTTDIVETAFARGLAELDGAAALRAVRAAGIPTLPSGLARTSEEAAELAARIRPPVSLRLAVHGAGGSPIPEPAFARLADGEAVRRAFRTLTDRAERRGDWASIAGCLVQAAAPKNSPALTAGFVRYPQFGSLLSFGLCGPASKIPNAVSYRLVPLFPEDARAMLDEVRFSPLLRGAGRDHAASLAGLERLLLALARLALRAPRIAVAELAPVFAGAGDALVAGAHLRLA